MSFASPATAFDGESAMSADARRTTALVLLAGLSAPSACRRAAPEPEPVTELSFRSQASSGVWTLVELFGSPAPLGAGARPATLAFEVDSARAGGFLGCNRYGAGYSVDGDSIAFGPIVSTKMACAEGMALERRVSEALEAAVRYEVTPDSLVLFGPAGAVARFERRR